MTASSPTFQPGDRVSVTDENHWSGQPVTFFGTVTTGVARADGKLAVKWDNGGPLFNDPTTLTQVA